MGKVSFDWYTSDVLSIRPDLSESEALDVLYGCDRVYDAEIGMNLFVLESVANDMYPKDRSRND